MPKTRAIVVDDSSTVRTYLVQTLAADPDIEVVAQAADGKEAIELIQKHRPDVVSMDMMMPGISGLSATEYVMAYCPTPILVVSASMNRGEVFKTYDALSAGAVDAMDKPSGDGYSADWEREYRSKLKLVAKIRVITHPRARLAGRGTMPENAAKTPTISGQDTGFRCLAIGASTGGPGAVLDLLLGLGKGFPLPVLLVIHIGEPFGWAMCDWLNGLSPLRVVCAEDGMRLPPIGKGRVIMAPHGRHLAIRSGQVALDDGPERHSCKPSVDVLFESVAREFGAGAIGCLLTGIGRDGALGMVAIRRAGGTTIAQDESTSVVFGMPKEAISLGVVRHVLPLGEIAPFVQNLVIAGGPR